MSRRCRASLVERGTTNEFEEDSFDSSVSCFTEPEEPCFEPLVYGSNVLLDPGFEEYPGYFGLNTGPDSETFPGEYAPSSAQPSVLLWADTQLYGGPLPYWAVFSNDGVGNNALNRWHIDTANPDTGTYHARFQTSTAVDYATASAELHPLGFYMCTRIQEWTTGFEDKNGFGPWAGIVQPGDLVTWSVMMIADVLTDTPTLQLSFNTADEDFDPSTNQWPSFSFPEWTLTASYARYTFSAFMPENAHYLDAVAAVRADSGPTVTTIFDMDDARLQIIQAGVELVLCTFSTLITVDNDTTETSFL